MVPGGVPPWALSLSSINWESTVWPRDERAEVDDEAAAGGADDDIDDATERNDAMTQQTNDPTTDGRKMVQW